MNWNKPILTDSGGYQVFSLAGTRKIKEEGVTFQSHIDGSKHLFTPENVMDIQRSIGGDIIMAFDECPPGGSEYNYAKTLWNLPIAGWIVVLINSIIHQINMVIRKIFFPLYKAVHLKICANNPVNILLQKKQTGNAIGGLSVGEPEEIMYEICDWCCDHLPQTKPRYLMGVGTPWNILECISLGIDMFDCVMPTRNGRNAMLFTTKGVINIDNKKWEFDFSPIDDGLDCEVSNYYSKAYLRHLMKSKEFLGFTIASIHNLAFYLWLMEE